MTPEQLRHTKRLLRHIKENKDKREYAIIRRMVLLAANMSGLDGMREYQWFIARLKEHINKEQTLGDFMDISERIRYNVDLYRVNTNTVVCEDYGTFINELIDKKVELLNKIKTIEEKESLRNIGYVV